MPQTQLSFHVPIELYLAIDEQAQLEGMVASRWIVEVAKSRLRALDKLPKDTISQKRFRKKVLESDDVVGKKFEVDDSADRTKNAADVLARKVLGE